MKIRINLKETSTAGSVYSAPSMESQEQQLPSDEELAIRDKEEAERQEQQAEKDRKEADKKAKEKAAKLPPADKAAGDKPEAEKDDESEDEEDAGEDDEADDSDDDLDEEDEESDDEDLDEEEDEDAADEDEDDEKATAASDVPVAPAPVTPRNRPYPDSYVETTTDVILPEVERELTPEELVEKAEKENEKPVTDNPDVIIPDKPKGNEGTPAGDNAGGAETGKDGDKVATQEVATASARQRPYPDCWD